MPLVIQHNNLPNKTPAAVHKWVVIPRLKQVTGVADVSNYGGITTQYQIEIDPRKMEQYGISLADISEKVEKNNINAGGSIVSRGDLGYVIRGFFLPECAYF